MVNTSNCFFQILVLHFSVFSCPSQSCLVGGNSFISDFLLFKGDAGLATQLLSLFLLRQRFPTK